MPKKFQGENSKSAQARARKEAKKNEDEEKKKKDIEDAYWADDDKHVQRKQKRKDDKERKHREQMERKQEAAKILEDEMSSLKPAKKEPKSKVTRAEIDAMKEQEAAEAKKTLMHDEVPLEENLNRLVVDGEEARNIEEAITVLNEKDDVADKHPEKRMRAAFIAYEEVNLPKLKEENPGLKLSQIKQILRKNWAKSPENPMNQVVKSYNVK